MFILQFCLLSLVWHTGCEAMSPSASAHSYRCALNTGCDARQREQVKASERPDETGRLARRRRVLRRLDSSLATGLAHWVIREVDTSHVPGARADRCLICESNEEGVIHRVWEYPEHWYELSDEELRRLCE